MQSHFARLSLGSTPVALGLTPPHSFQSAQAQAIYLVDSLHFSLWTTPHMCSGFLGRELLLGRRVAVLLVLALCGWNQARRQNQARDRFCKGPKQ